MARRELSSTLKNLKFMQRAALREERTKKEEEVKPDVSVGTSTAVTRKCVVIMEGDPHPGAAKGRMSFQSFNPLVDKLNEEEARLHQPAAETTMSRNQNANANIRENRSPVEGPECGNMDKKIVEVNGNAKRKQSDYEAQYPNKSPKNDHDDKHSSPSNSLGSFKKPSGDKLDWKVLRPSSVKQSR
ncbi:hypothetical protein AAZX31_13G319000 [Glycine max]|uniref:M-phase phosphoprotein 6 n=1 Tax=Glycine max TaxID=3847 RepID=C6T2F8_SOYBN|nr:uncharacterized protein LOC100500671 [Glycine max]ACU15813.1 unknown [Glycine max]KAG4972378.1 hypothetical protein JHK85_038799 [Glycine max]KAG5114779.1 hypothetical protein JHK82_038048 [Glycine max]KAG5132061.1 hypothetical protein JHK84_038458 [Glycine max]KAH1104725.1 hypothetical protein GYH30_038205 [Glycine max]|eukprot:NP_001237703.1 uncharacterized protein LOC100500671 [Glycine max]